MNKKYFIIVLLILLMFPIQVFASGGFNISNLEISMYKGETKSVTITTDNAVGKLNISSSNSMVAAVNPSSLFIQTPGASDTISIEGKEVGSSTISVVATESFATMDEEILEGQTKKILVNIIEKTNETPKQEEKPKEETKPVNPDKPIDEIKELSKNNNLKSISVDNYNLVKLNDNNYTLVVANNVTIININAKAEDEKATISGIGAKELKVGENNFDVIVKSESGEENKINVKVTRKVGYYLEDLSILLKDETNQEIDIIMTYDNVISKELINQMKDSNKIVRFNYYDNNKKLLYSFKINNNKLQETKDLSTSILYTFEGIEDIHRISNYAEGIYLSILNETKNNNAVSLKLFIGDKFLSQDIVNLYVYNLATNKMEILKTNLEVVDGYIEFNLVDGSKYLITKSKLDSTVKNDETTKYFLIASITGLTLITILVIILIYKRNKKKKA